MEFRLRLKPWCCLVIATIGVVQFSMPATDRLSDQRCPDANPVAFVGRTGIRSLSKLKRAEIRQVLGVIGKLLVANNPTDLEDPGEFGDLGRQVAEVKTRKELQALLVPYVLLQVKINPESRVKISPSGSEVMRDKVKLEKDVANRFLLQVDNHAGVTSTLNISAIDLSLQPPQTADWITAIVVNEDGISSKMSGQKIEYLVIELLAKESGLKEVRLVGDAGQGTQDLGFRATADLLIDVK